VTKPLFNLICRGDLRKGDARTDRRHFLSKARQRLSPAFKGVR